MVYDQHHDHFFFVLGRYDFSVLGNLAVDLAG